jgi:histidine ammonia-lyase
VRELQLSGNDLSLADITLWASGGIPRLSIKKAALAQVARSADYVQKLSLGEGPVYGVNTGFGLLSDVKIPSDQLAQLQLNLVRSHAVGVGPALSLAESRAALLLRTNTLAKGHSGVSVALLKKLVEIQNAGIVPWVPEQGSVGACGDLAPLAHMALVIIGEGRCWYKGRWQDSQRALKAAGIKAHRLGPKEGLSLINGTQVMTAIGALVLEEAAALAKVADIAGALSLECVRGTAQAFAPEVQRVRPHKEQALVANNLRALLASSAVMDSHKNCGRVQDPYSFRCMPQVHGASRRLLSQARETLEIEANSATDNPLVFPPAKRGRGGKMISGGNFHGEYVAMAMDTVAIALAEFANISDLRLQKLINPAFSGLPAFLTPNPGLNSGLMIVQVASASLVSENKVLAHPASVDSIPTSADKEDHVSMGVTAARKARSILINLRHTLAMELLGGFQGLHLLRPLRSSPPLERAWACIRSRVAPIEEDRIFHHDIVAIAELLESGELLAAVEGRQFPLH